MDAIEEASVRRKVGRRRKALSQQIPGESAMHSGRLPEGGGGGGGGGDIFWMDMKGEHVPNRGGSNTIINEEVELEEFAKRFERVRRYDYNEYITRTDRNDDDDDDVDGGGGEKDAVESYPEFLHTDMETQTWDWAEVEEEMDMDQETEVSFQMGDERGEDNDIFSDAVEQLRHELVTAGLEDARTIDEILEDILRQLRHVEEDLDDVPPPPRPPPPKVECPICLELKQITPRSCCSAAFCHDCMATHARIRVRGGQIKVPCPSPRCDSMVHRAEIYSLLDQNLKKKFDKFLVDANDDPSKKTCPRCSHVHTVDRHVLPAGKAKKEDILVTCSECRLQWCFRCHAPWHDGITCAKYIKGDVLFGNWVKKRTTSYERNAQPCPKCKTFIQKSSGCSHMTCRQCATDFCYRCGEKYRHIMFLGDHNSMLGVLGCKYRYSPKNAAKRWLVRGSLLGLFTLLASPILVFILPVWGCYRLHRLRKARQHQQTSTYL